jgi:uncharacterized protein
MENNKPDKFWSPLAAGIGLGIALMGMFIFTGHGLGANGFFKRLTIWLSDLSFSEWTHANAYFGNLASRGNLFDKWISWEVLGIAVGVLVGSVLAKRFKFKVEKGLNVSVPLRLGLAVIGGILTGFGASLARGCTSGLGLSGGATLAVGAFVLLMGFFIAGLVVSRLTRKVW